jgi:hypothetical protein
VGSPGGLLNDPGPLPRPRRREVGSVHYERASVLRQCSIQPHAAYLFIEEGEGYVGKRLSLTKIGQEDDAEKIESLRRRNLPDECDEGETRYLVHFRIDGVRPLIGTE